VQQIGHYRIISELGRGGMGVVYRAHDPRSGRDVAIKLVIGLDDRAHKRLTREARALARLRHPAIATVHELGEHGGAPFMVMDHVEGVSLQVYLDRDGPFGVAEALEIVNDVGQGLSAAHEAGVLHRDLKPDNVIMTARGHAVLVDFGLAWDGNETSASRLTRTGNMIGTPGYWAPELAHGALDALAPPCDVYGLAATLYAMITGHAPHEGESLVEIVSKLDEPVAPASSWNPDVSPYLDRALARALAPRPQDRPPTVQRLLEELSGAGTARSMARPGLKVAGAVAAAAVVLGGFVSWNTGRLDGPVAGKSPEASPRLEQAPQPAPSSPNAPAADQADRAAATKALQEGQAQLAAGDTEAALASYDRAITLEPTSLQAYRLRSQAHSRLGNVENALDDAERALRLDPDDPHALSQRGGLRAHLGDRAGGLEDLNRALELLPGQAGALFNRGFVHEAEGELALAAADYGRAVQANPDYVRAWFQRGLVRSKLGEDRGARDDWSQVLRLDPAYRRAHSNRAVARFRLGDHVGAREDYEQELTLDPPADESSRIQGSIAEIEASVASLPDPQLDARGWLERGQAQLDLDPALAEGSFSRGLWLAPTDGVLWFHRGFAREQQGDLRGALSDASRAIGSGLGHANVFYNRSSLRLRVRVDLEGCVADAGRALALEPEHRDARLTRGVALGALQRFPKAIADAEYLLAREPGDAQALFLRGMCRSHLGELDQAVADIERAIELDQDPARREGYRPELERIRRERE